MNVSDHGKGMKPWRGQSWPRTMTGRSALVEPLPHHISCDSLHVSFKADPQKIANLLPPGLEPLESGEGWVMIAEMAKVSVEDPDNGWKAPARSSYNECVLGFYCRFGDRLGRYSALVWVDRDWSMGMGPIFGWSKRLAEVDRTRHQRANPHFASGPYVLGGTVSRYGATIVEMAIRFDEEQKSLERLPGHGGSTFLYRYVASPSPDVDDLEQLFELQLDNVVTRNIREGAGSLHFGKAPDEELAELGEVTVTGGYSYERGWTTGRNARLIHDYHASSPSGDKPDLNSTHATSKPQ